VTKFERKLEAGTRTLTLGSETAESEYVTEYILYYMYLPMLVNVKYVYKQSFT